MTIFTRVWAMPNHDTFSVPPIGAFVQKYLKSSSHSIDPFARNKRWADQTNDLNPDTAAEHHMDAVDFLRMMQGKVFDLAIVDPPYSPRQISECYKGVGRSVGMKETQSAVLYKNVRDALDPLIDQEGIVLHFGWNSVGMGVKRGYELIEVLICCHGGAHNDTICIAERKIKRLI